MRIDSGIDGFDRLVEGGMPEGRLYLVSGPPGSGKTTFASQFITEGAKNGERGLFVSMHETRSDIVSDMSGYDFGFERALRSDQVTYIDAFSSEGKRFFGLPGEHRDRTSLTNRVVSFVDSRNVDRLVIDSTMLLRYFFSEEEDTVMHFLSSLKRTDATTVLISEMTDPTAYSDEHYLAHGVVFLHNYLEEGGMTRGIQVVKMRGTDVDTDIHAVEFDDAGLAVFPEQAVPQ